MYDKTGRLPSRYIPGRDEMYVTALHKSYTHLPSLWLRNQPAAISCRIAPDTNNSQPDTPGFHHIAPSSFSHELAHLGIAFMVARDAASLWLM